MLCSINNFMHITKIMSNLVNQLEILRNSVLINEIKYYNVFVNVYSIKCAIFVTNKDKVYGIDIQSDLMTSSYESVNNDKMENENQRKSEPIEIKELSDKNIKEFYCGFNFILAMNENKNKLYSWGNNEHGQLGRITENNYDNNPTEIIFQTNSRTKIKQVCVCDCTVMVVLDNGKVIVWGYNEFGWKTENYIFSVIITEDFDQKCIRKPTELNCLSEIIFIQLNLSGCFAIDMNYNVFSWGENEHGELGHKKLFPFIPIPKISESLSKLKIFMMKKVYNVTYLLSSKGKLYICGKDCESNESIDNELNLIQIKSKEYFTRLEKIHLNIVALSYTQIVYEINGNVLTKTEYNSFERIFCNEMWINI